MNLKTDSIGSLWALILLAFASFTHAGPQPSTINALKPEHGQAFPAYRDKDIVEGEFVVKFREKMDTSRAKKKIFESLQPETPDPQLLQRQSQQGSSATKGPSPSLFSDAISLTPLFVSLASNPKAASVRMRAKAQHKQDSLQLWRHLAIKHTDLDSGQILRRLSKSAEIEYVEPVLRRNIQQTTTTDTDHQWYLDWMELTSAYDYLQSQGQQPGGSQNVVVAVLDTGIDTSHPALRDALWVNNGEISDNGFDDDGNGVVDDYHGANFVADVNNGDIIDQHGHGTHVAGIVAAQDNGSGVTGIAHNTRLMTVKTANNAGFLTSVDIAEAIVYAAANGADVINMSFGGYFRSNLENDALAYAFTSSVLVASAGNDGRYNEQGCSADYAPLYPASYNWVLGVMAHASQPDLQGNYLAGFSNRDCKPGSIYEYELMAPGVQILSTVVGGGTAAWSGTSMAAPMVSAVAALTRSHWPDKNLYSSRYIMGQLAGTADMDLDYPSINAHGALTQAPQPRIGFQEYHLFDDKSLSAANDVDGQADTGEIIELGLTLKNRWGAADQVQVKLQPRLKDSPVDDPNVIILQDEIQMGSIGPFATLDNLLYNDEGEITGLSQAFRIQIPTDTPNNYVLPFSILITASQNSGGEISEFVFEEDAFLLIVSNGKALPTVISADMTLTDEHLWLVQSPVLVDKDATLTITPGTKVQFWTSDPERPQSGELEPYLHVKGSLKVEGSAEKPVQLFPSALYQFNAVQITKSQSGSVTMEYVEIDNPWLGSGISNEKLDYIEHGRFAFLSEQSMNSPENSYSWVPKLNIENINYSYFSNLNSFRGTYIDDFIAAHQGDTNLYDGVVLDGNVVQAHKNSVFLRNFRTQGNVMPDDIEWNNYNTQLNNVGSAIHPTTFAHLDPVQYNGSSYLVVVNHNKVADQDAAFARMEAFAQYLGGHLVTFNDQAELEQVKALIDQEFELYDSKYADLDCGSLSCKDLFLPSYITDVMIGLNDIDQDGHYSWISGESSTANMALHREGSSYVLVATDLSYISSFDSFTLYPSLIEIPRQIALEEIQTLREEYLVESSDSSEFLNNAILNYWWSDKPDHWLRFITTDSAPLYETAADEWTYRLDYNYWGTHAEGLVASSLLDFSDGLFESGTYQYLPMLETAPEQAYPFVTAVRVNTNSATDVSEFNIEPLSINLSFNRAMDTSVQPGVFLAPNAPYTDHPISGDWIDSRTWQGHYDVPPTIEYGYQYLSVYDAVAADDPWLKTGKDFARFRFQVSSSGAASISQLTATPRDNHIELNWDHEHSQANMATNLYRATDEEGDYSLIYRSFGNDQQGTFLDHNVSAGQNYFYKLSFSTNGSESERSDAASATPVAVTIAPPPPPPSDNNSDGGSDSGGGGSLGGFMLLLTLFGLRKRRH